MKTYILQRTQRVPAPLERVFPFFADAANLDTITPPWLRFRILTPTPAEMCPGRTLDYRLRYRGLPVRWRTLIEVWDPPTRFVDCQVRGPYALWRHEHRFHPAGEDTVMTDTVHYALPLGPIGRLVHATLVRRDVNRIFDYRHERIADLFATRRDQSAHRAVAGA